MDQGESLSEEDVRREFAIYGTIDVYGSIGDKATVSFVQGEEKVELPIHHSWVNMKAKMFYITGSGCGVGSLCSAYKWLVKV